MNDEEIRGIVEMGYLFGVNIWDLLLGLGSRMEKETPIND